jgi:UDP-glucose 4-epimerase
MIKKILLLGGYGFIGSFFFKTYRKKYKIYRFGRFLKNQKITLSRLLKINTAFDIIIDCSGGSSVSESINNPKKEYSKTILTIKSIIKFLKKLKKKPIYVFLSSAAVYGNSKGKKLVPISNYGRNKLYAENALKKISKKEKIRLIIIRFYSIFGNGLKKQLIWDTMKKISKNQILFFGTGNEKRSWLHVCDAVKLIEASILISRVNGKIIDAPSKYTLQNKVMIKKIFNILKYKKKPIFRNINRLGDPSELITKKKKYKNLKWKQKKNLDQELKNYVKWYLNK